jgi:hypothetical protein
MQQHKVDNPHLIFHNEKVTSHAWKITEMIRAISLIVTFRENVAMRMPLVTASPLVEG